MDKRTLSEADRNRELHRLLDDIPLPDEASNSDLSSELASNFGHEPQSFVHQMSPREGEADYFGNSMNSSISKNSDHTKSLHFDDDSQLDLSRNSQMGAFTPQQVSKMMNWSRNYVTPADGLFPQVSAPSISIDPEDHLFGRSDHATPHESYFNPVSHPVSRATSKKETTSISYERNDRSSQRTGSEHSRPPRKDQSTFSPSHVQESNWFYTPGVQPQKRQVMDTSHRSHPRSNASSDFVNQGSSLMSMHHVGCTPLLPEPELALNREQIREDMQKLIRELTALKIENRGLRESVEAHGHELDSVKEACRELEYNNQQLVHTKAELEEHLMLTQAHSRGTLEQFRGRALELARTEMAQLKNSVLDRDKKISELRQALSAKNLGESGGTKSKEIDDLTMELTRLKILNSSLSKQQGELNAHLKKETKHREHLQQELGKALEMLQAGKVDTDLVLSQRAAELGEKQKYIERLHSALKESEGTLKLWNEAKNKEKEEIRQLKDAIHVLQCENQDLKHGRTSNTDYEGQMRKLKDSYEQRILTANEQLADAKSRLKALEDRNKALQTELAKLSDSASDKENIMEKEYTIEIMTSERDQLIQELETLRSLVNELKADLEEANSKSSLLKKSLEAETAETKGLRHALETERKQFQEKLQSQDGRYSELNRTIRTLQDEITATREECRIQAEAARQATGTRMKLEDEVMLYREKLATFGATPRAEQGVMTSFELPMFLSTGSEGLGKSLDRSRSKDYAGILEAKELENDQLFREKQYFEGEAKQLKDTIEGLKQALRECNEEAPKVPCSTQTCNELLAIIRSELNSELEDPEPEELTQKLKLALEDQRDELQQDATRRLKEAETNYQAKREALEEDHRVSLKTLKRDYEDDLKASKKEHDRLTAELRMKILEKDAETAKLECSLAELEAEVHDLKANCASLESKLSAKQSSITSEAESRKKLADLEKTNKAKLRELEHLHDMEKLQLTQSMQKTEDAKVKLEHQLAAMHKEQEALQNQLHRLQELDEQLRLKFEAKLQAAEVKHAQELTSLNDRLTKEYRNKEAELLGKLEAVSKRHETEVQEVQQDYEDQLEAERRRYKELLTVKDPKEPQSSCEDLSTLVTERETQWTQRMSLAEKTLRSQFENDLLDKEQAWTATLTESQAQHLALVKELEDSISNLKAKHKDTLSSIKEEHLKTKRELERELKKMKELLDKANDSAQKDTELLELERANAERREADRKMKQKTMLLQHKHAKEIQDREAALKLELEKEKADALKALSESHKKALKTKETELKQKYEADLEEALAAKLRETELQVRKELAEQHIIELGKLDMEHLAQRERIRDDLRSEYEKRMGEWRRTASSHHASFYELPVKHTANASMIHLQDSVDYDFEPEKPAVSSSMIVDDSRQSADSRQQSPEKQNVQSLVLMMSDLARKDEGEKIYKFLSSELDAYLSGSPTKSCKFPEIKALLHGYLTQLAKRTLTSPRALAPKDLVRTPREKNSGLEFSPDKNFLKYDRWVYIAADKVVEDLEQVKTALLAAANKQIPTNYPCKSARKAVEHRPQHDYRELVQTLWQLAGDAHSALRKGMDDSRMADSDEVVRLRLVIAEYRDKLARYEKELKSMTVEYKNFILKTNQRIQRLGSEKQAVELQLEGVTTQLKTAEAKIKRLEDTPTLSPEMLSPEETVQLVINVLKRSSRDSLLSQLSVLQSPR